MIKKLIHNIFLLFIFVTSYSQDEINVLTKKIEQTFDCFENNEIKIDAIKADINLKNWNKEQIKVTAYLIAKNKDLKLGKQELNFIKCYINKTGKTVIVKNIFSIPEKAKKVSSVLQIKYEIYTPPNIQINIKNRFGDNILEDIHGNATLSLDYGALSINNFSGKATIHAKFVNINAKNLYGSFNLYSENSDVVLNNLNDLIDLKSKTGKINITTGNSVKKLKINAEYCSILLQNPGFNLFNYTLYAKYSEIDLPVNKLRDQFVITKTKDKFEYKTADNNPSIFISTSFNKIKITEQ